MTATREYKRGDKVTCNGNDQARILEKQPVGPCSTRTEGMYIVRLWHGFRHVGDVVVSKRDLDLENVGR